MFNVHQYEKKLTEKQRVDKMKHQYIDDQEKRKNLNSKLAANYKKRVENFVINMLENPLQINEYKAPKAYKIRDDKPEKFVGDAQFYVKGFKHEKDRIKEAQRKFSDLDYFPNRVYASHQFRTREKAKEIQADMKFTSKTSLERIEAFLKQHMQTQVENIDFRQERKKKNGDLGDLIIWEQDKKIPRSFTKRALIARDLAKNLLPSLHNKTHFQAAEVMYNSQPLSVVDKTKTFHKSSPNLLSAELTQQQDKSMQQGGDKSQQKDGKGVQISDPVQEDNIQDDENGKKGNQQKTDQMEAFNPVETSQKVLKECKIIKDKNPKVKRVVPGSGHLISMNDKSISEIYDQFYPRPVHNKFPQLYATQQFQSSYNN